MSADSAKKFLDRIKTDEEFRKTFLALHGEGVQEAITAHGYEFTLAELQEALISVVVSGGLPTEIAEMMNAIVLGETW